RKGRPQVAFHGFLCRTPHLRRRTFRAHRDGDRAGADTAPLPSRTGRAAAARLRMGRVDAPPGRTEDAGHGIAGAGMTSPRLTTIGFDADDTLWQNEQFYHATQSRFIELLKDHADRGELPDRLLEVMLRNVDHYGV